MKERLVLVLDDEKNILSSLKRLFRNEPFDIMTTSDHEEALALLRSEKTIKVVMSDQRMPAISGVEFLQKVRDEFPEIVRILFTGYTDIQALEDAINKGAVYRFVNKPWNDEELKVAIRQGIEFFDLVAMNKTLLETTRRQNEDLKRLDTLKSEFIANVSHELRTPLNSMNIVLGNIRKGVAGDFNLLPEKLRAYIDMIDRNNRNLRAIVNDLLDIFKLSSDGFSLNRSPGDIGRSVEAEVAEMKTQADAKGVALQLSLQPVPAVLIDEERIRQVIRNLVSNAIKFTDGGGSVTVTVADREGQAACAVTDTGIGIAPENLEAVFDRFVQVEQKAMGKPKGTGLGLSISKRIIELHNGKIWVESSPGRGSTFTFMLPVSGGDEQRKGLGL